MYGVPLLFVIGQTESLILLNTKYNLYSWLLVSDHWVIIVNACRFAITIFLWDRDDIVIVSDLDLKGLAYLQD